jgi:hypothetical protein
MMLMIPKVYAGDVKPDFLPDPKAMERMGEFNDKLRKAGVLLSLDGLTPPAKGARVKFAGGKGTATDGPFAEAKELIGGYWLIQAKSKEEAVAWALRCPADDGDIIEIRQVFEESDFE